MWYGKIWKGTLLQGSQYFDWHSKQVFSGTQDKHVDWFCDRFNIIVSRISAIIGWCNRMAGYSGILQNCINVREVKFISVESGEQWTQFLLFWLSSGTTVENV
jgi:hypothetical protein